MDVLVFSLIVLNILFFVWIFIMESILWETPYVMKAFGTTPETAASGRELAINQGVYNLFLAAGLVWSLIASDPTSFQAKVFFLSCIVVAAITVGVVSSKRLMVVQGMPAVVTLALVLATH
jgi:putative membrane protein